MSWWASALIAFAACILCRILINARRLLRLRLIYGLYQEWLASESNRFAEYQPELIDLFRKANLKNGVFPATEAVGFGQITGFQASYFENVHSNRRDVVAQTIRYFDSANGQFRRNILESINPICWIEFIVFLPKHLLGYLNINEQSILTKIALIIWWVIAPLAVILRDKLYDVISKTLG